MVDILHSVRGSPILRALSDRVTKPTLENVVPRTNGMVKFCGRVALGMITLVLLPCHGWR